ncbi:MAG: hypothetical protein ABI885_05775 [Gammaproteobacteria bacterium]
MKIWTAAAFAMMLGLTTIVSAADTPDYDVVVRNGRVLDGLGNPWATTEGQESA